MTKLLIFTHHGYPEQVYIYKMIGGIAHVFIPESRQWQTVHVDKPGLFTDLDHVETFMTERGYSLVERVK